MRYEVLRPGCQAWNLCGGGTRHKGESGGLPLHPAPRPRPARTRGLVRRGIRGDPYQYLGAKPAEVS